MFKGISTVAEIKLAWITGPLLVWNFVGIQIIYQTHLLQILLPAFLYQFVPIYFLLFFSLYFQIFTHIVFNLMAKITVAYSVRCLHGCSLRYGRHAPLCNDDLWMTVPEPFSLTKKQFVTALRQKKRQQTS